MSTRSVALFAFALIVAGCGPRPAEPDPPKPPVASRPAYYEIPLNIEFSDIPEVPEKIQGPSPPIAEAKAEKEEKKPSGTIFGADWWGSGDAKESDNKGK